MISNYSLLSQFKYGADHLKIAFASKKGINPPTSKQRFKEAMIGFAELIPFVGLIIAGAEHRSLNRLSYLKSAKAIVRREQMINRQINSKSGLIQKIYFDAFSGLTRRNHGSGIEKLGYASPDKSFLSLYNQLLRFQKSEENCFSAEEKREVENALGQLELAKPIALKLGILLHLHGTKKKALMDSLSGDLEQYVKKMQPGESRIIPAGYLIGDVYDLIGAALNKFGGHSILLKVTKNLTGETFKIETTNTGLGANLHENEVDRYRPYEKKMDRYRPFVVENIKAADLNRQFFDKLVAFANVKPTAPGLGGVVIGSFYNFLRSVGTENKQTATKPYKDQGSVDNCTHKCLTVWLHRQLSERIYLKFKKHSLESSINLLQKRKLHKKLQISYQHSLMRLGVGRASVFTNGFTKTLNFFFGNHLNLKMKRKEIAYLHEGAKVQLAHVKTKIQMQSIDPDFYKKF